MPSELNVYAYNVRFGDCILVEMIDGTKRSFILVDAGNWQRGQAGSNQPLLDALKDIRARTGGRIDLYVMTHEHMDHVEGLRAADAQGCRFSIGTVWMTASSEPGYYDTFTDARNQKKKLQDTVDAFQALSASSFSEELKALFEFYAASTADCVEFIRKAGTNGTHYVYRGCDLSGKNPLPNGRISILAPEQDSAVYYRSLSASFPYHGVAPTETPPVAANAPPLPPPGVDGGAFYELIGRMDGSYSESAFAIDKAGNNTSVVFELTWRGRRLLFTGDAEQANWQQIVDKASLSPVDVLKMAHHGSSNGMPPLAALDKILPKERRHSAVAILSTFPGDPFESVPDAATVNAIKTRTSNIYCTNDVADGTPVKVTLTPAD